MSETLEPIEAWLLCEAFEARLDPDRAARFKQAAMEIVRLRGEIAAGVAEGMAKAAEIARAEGMKDSQRIAIVYAESIAMAILAAAPRGTNVYLLRAATKHTAHQ